MKSLLSRVAVALLMSSFPALSTWAQPPSEEMAEAARNFLSALNSEQRGKAVYEFKHDERFNWAFVPKARNGLPFKEMTENQRQLGRALLRTGLSQQGYTKATNIIVTLEQVLKELEGGAARRDPELYYFTIFGEPGKSPWAWRVEGHHLALNFTIAGNDALTVTPSFFGSNPGEVQSGPHKGLRTLAGEEDFARRLVNDLDAKQREVAVIATDAPRDIITGNSRTARPLDPKGISADKLTAAQQELLLSVIKEYVFRYRTEIAEKDLKKIQDAGFDRIHFAWAGSLDRGSGHYYRVQGPTFLLEYDNTQNRANHIHSVWRDLENDFGEDLLRKHYEQAPHVH